MQTGSVNLLYSLAKFEKIEEHGLTFPQNSIN